VRDEGLVPLGGFVGVVGVGFGACVGRSWGLGFAFGLRDGVGGVFGLLCGIIGGGGSHWRDLLVSRCFAAWSLVDVLMGDESCLLDDGVVAGRWSGIGCSCGGGFCGGFWAGGWYWVEWAAWGLVVTVSWGGWGFGW